MTISPHAVFAYLPVELTRPFVRDVFRGLGVPDGDAEICADVITAADLRGMDSHGLGRLKPIYYDRILKDKIQNPVTHFEVVRDRGAIAVVDGHHGMGMVIGHKSMQLAMAKAREHGLGAVAVRNSTHYGIAGYYVLLATREDMIGFTCTNARPSIAPTFGVENLLGTNPLVFGFPTDEPFPFTNDYAVSVTQRGKIEQYAREGRQLPPGWVMSDQGEYILDPQVALKALTEGTASLVPLGGIGEETGGYKGYGFATVAEILSAALQQGASLRQLTGTGPNGEKVPYRLGHFFMAIDISFFVEVDAFKKTVGDILRTLRNSKKMPGATRIYTCGEKEYLTELERRVHGIPIDRVVGQQLVEMRNELGLHQYRFPFE